MTETESEELYRQLNNPGVLTAPMSIGLAESEVRRNFAPAFTIQCVGHLLVEVVQEGLAAVIEQQQAAAGKIALSTTVHPHRNAHFISGCYDRWRMHKHEAKAAAPAEAIADVG